MLLVLRGGGVRAGEPEDVWFAYGMGRLRGARVASADEGVRFSGRCSGGGGAGAGC